MSNAKRTNQQRTGWATRLLAMAPLVVVGALLVVLASAAQPAISNGAMTATGPWGMGEGKYALGPLIFGTLVTGIYAAIGAVLLGTPAALYLAWYAPRRIGRLGTGIMRIFSALPTVVIGLMGMALISPVLGANAFTAAVCLLVLALPTYTLLVTTAAHSMGEDLPATLKSLGVDRGRPTARLVLRELRPRLIAAAGITAARVLGDAVIVSRVSGNVESWSLGPEPVLTLAGAIANKYEAAPDPIAQSALAAAGVAIALVVGAAVSVAIAAERRG